MALLRPRDLSQRLGVSLTTLWRWTKAGDFPIPYRLGANSVAFDELEIAEWLKTRRGAPAAIAANRTDAGRA